MGVETPLAHTLRLLILGARQGRARALTRALVWRGEEWREGREEEEEEGCCEGQAGCGRLWHLAVVTGRRKGAEFKPQVLFMDGLYRAGSCCQLALGRRRS